MSDGAWIAPLDPQLVWFSGSDAERFLDDLISQEIKGMGDGDALRSFLLGPQGKLQFLLWVVRQGDRLGLLSEEGRGEELASLLGRYRIRVDVAIEMETEPVWVVVGEGEGYDISWPGQPRRLVIGTAPNLPTGSNADLDAVRVAAGEPWWGVEVDESTIPHATGLVPVSVDFTKGCYLGQELVARVDSRGGNVPERLMRVESVDGLLEVGPLTHPEVGEAGRVTTVAGEAGLAMVKRAVAPDEQVSVGGVAAIVKSLSDISPG